MHKHFLFTRTGMSQFEPQPADLGPNGKLGGMYGGMYVVYICQIFDNQIFINTRKPSF